MNDEKKIILMISLLVIILLLGCARGDYETFIEMIEPKPTGEHALYEDDNITIIFTLYRTFDMKGFTFSLKNKSDQTIKIVWDEVVILDSNYNSYEIIHEGINPIDKDKPMKNAVVPPGAQRVETVIPTDIIKWNSKLDYWETRAFIETLQLFDGKVEKASLILPLIIGEEKETYSFNFKIYVIRYE